MLPSSANGVITSVINGMATRFAANPIRDSCWKHTSVSGARPRVAIHCVRIPPHTLSRNAEPNLLHRATAAGRSDSACRSKTFPRPDTISNPTAAAPDQILGYGCGLTIIQRICEKLGWQIETRLEDGVFSARLAMNAPDLTQA